MMAANAAPRYGFVETGSNANVAEFYHHSNISALTIDLQWQCRYWN